MPTNTLRRDAVALYDAATAFIRHYQFRNRDQALAFGLTVVQAYALDLLVNSHGETLTALAAALHLDKSTMSRIVAGMQRRGLVDGRRSAGDRRAMAIAASKKGRRRYERLRHAIVRDNERLLAQYPAAERRAIVDVLRRLADRTLAHATPRE
jgi:DNA-binding MarR family transcriptional regulator